MVEVWQELRAGELAGALPRVPHEIRYMAEEMTSPRALFHELWTWAVDDGLNPGFDVDLYIEPDGLIGRWVFEFVTNARPSPAQVEEATTIMARHAQEPAWWEPVIEETANGQEDGKRAGWKLYL